MTLQNIGITTTVPMEILMAAGYRPVDLNNILVTDINPERLVTLAEKDGFPLNCCSWIKGIYGVCRDTGVERVLCVTGGDCSNTQMLMEVFRLRGLDVIPFAYPEEPDISAVRKALSGLAARLGVTLSAAETVRRQLKSCRQAVLKLDEMTWRENNVTGWENHLWLVSSSDFNRDPEEYHSQVSQLIAECGKRQAYPDDFLRLAYIGVPPVYARDIYDFLETQGAHVVYNEIQRQFAMPLSGQTLARQYANYTYPYNIWGRLDDIEKEISLRRMDGVIHYVQAFCHRGIGDIVFRDKLSQPILTLEGNDEFFLNAHAKTRLEAFLDMLRRRGPK